MVKIKSKWVCQNCGYETAGYLGKCPDCASWGSITEEVKSAPISKGSAKIADEVPATLIDDVQIPQTIRFSTGMEEFDRVLGGGLVNGSLVLLAGDPGIGKSTLVLQTSRILGENKKVLYISAEESASQVKLRAQRLGAKGSNVYIYPQTCLDNIAEQISTIQPDFMILDSIQAVYSQGISSSPGTVSQIRECTNMLMNIAKNKGITTIIIGHVTKEGNIAGPKILEHMVDCVIYFEGDKFRQFRILRCIKNRFGNTNEVGVFCMSDDGLNEVVNPSEMFLKEREENFTPGCVVIATNEGTRPLLVEIQALVGTTTYASPRRVANGLEYNRLLQILAVLEKRIGISLSKQDVYVNVIGGLEILEPASDLGVALSVASCARDKEIDSKTVIVGELGLSGEVRNVNNLERRIKESEKLGFERIIVPYSSNWQKIQNTKIKIAPVKNLSDALNFCLKNKVR